MLNLQPKYKLDRRYKGPFIIRTLTDTNAVIHVQGDPNAEELNVTQQWSSKCVKAMEMAKPWVGQLGRLRRRCVVRKPVLPADDCTQGVDLSLPPTTITRHGRQVRRPARFSVIKNDTPEGLSFKGGEVVEPVLV